MYVSVCFFVSIVTWEEFASLFDGGSEGRIKERRNKRCCLFLRKVVRRGAENVNENHTA